MYQIILIQKKMEKIEAQIQQECFIWLTNTYGLKTDSKRAVMFSIPNEIVMAIRSALIQFKVPKRLVDQIIAFAIKKIKNTGFLPGVSDTIVALPNSITLYVEFKTPIGVQSVDQKEFQSILDNIGHNYHICRSVEDFKILINSHY